ncbi:MAG: YigZ family protein [Bacteroidetes bacterium]|jgi:uncharacterized YigZ family protein|nr:MAG: hypothetical protein ABR90_02215 [Cryomorphaceae bacterium BACL29 MAG-121220-bin8]MDA0757360.1 YigZ family protein [Bacteroidota bacterium]
MKNTYRTINIKAEFLFKEKQSKFFGYAFPVSEHEDIKKQIEKLKKKHHSARHFCYAYQIGVTNTVYRLNDDGEPRNSAGIPIYGQIQSFEITNILIVVVRYFGGIKLGIGGLAFAYKECAKQTLEASEIITKEIIIPVQIKFDYPSMNKVMPIIKKYNIEIVSQEMQTDCVFNILTTKKNNAEVCGKFKRYSGIILQKL